MTWKASYGSCVTRMDHCVEPLQLEGVHPFFVCCECFSCFKESAFCQGNSSIYRFRVKVFKQVSQVLYQSTLSVLSVYQEFRGLIWSQYTIVRIFKLASDCNLMHAEGSTPLVPCSGHFNNILLIWVQCFRDTAAILLNIVKLSEAVMQVQLVTLMAVALAESKPGSNLTFGS